MTLQKLEELLGAPVFGQFNGWGLLLVAACVVVAVYLLFKKN